MSGLLFQAVQDTLKTFSRDPRYLAAMPGLLLALHTWGRSLSLHPHLHVLTRGRSQLSQINTEAR